MSKIYISGSLAYDHIMDFPGLFRDHFIPGKLHNINLSFNLSTLRENFGGTSGNVAYSLNLLGEDSSIIATAGKDFERYRVYLESIGIMTDDIHINDGEMTASAYIMTDEADNQIAGFYPGALATPYGSDFAPSAGSLAIISAGCLDDMRTLPDKFRGHGVPFLFDPGQAILAMTGNDLRNGMTDASAVFANDYEFAMIAEKTGLREKEIVQLAKVLVITLGSEGSRVVTAEGEKIIKAVPAAELKDPTGAGDAYRAGYIKGLLTGLPPHICAQLGSTVAVYAVESYGTQNHKFTLPELRERYLVAYNQEITLADRPE